MHSQVEDSHVHQAITCMGDTECQKRGGECIVDEMACYDGSTITTDPMGCDATSAPMCCMPDACTPAGMSYYPMSGSCCPGLVGLTSIEVAEPWEPGDEGLICMIGCWALVCAPCGDGTCSPHLGENYCSCPRDCPRPPIDLTCYSDDIECGARFCRQEGATCHEEWPRCSSGVCSIDTSDHPGWVCDCTTQSCVAP
jgi:hypothetical protein